jgi:hypothetical protein
VDPVRLNDTEPVTPPASEPARATNATVADPTLDELLHSVAYTRLPAQFYQLLQLAIPLAAELWSWGWRLSAGWMTLLSLYGLWALCAKRIDEAESDAHLSPWLQIGRAATKGTGLALGGILGVVTILRLFGLIFHGLCCSG